MQYEDYFDALTPENRVTALLHYFGWQGGTIHQLASETGVDAQTLLHGKAARPNLDGFSAIRTCDKAWRVERLAPKHKGDWPYWEGVIRGYWATGALDRLDRSSL